MALKNKLFWEKYRPKSFKQLILLPRIENFLKKGIETNLIFYSQPGMGKSSLAKILCNGLNVLELNTSLETSIDVLREQITEHCETLSFQYNRDTMKVVLLEEFENASYQYQCGLKSFIEKYSDTVRFILTTNHIDKIESELQSRFNLVNFDPLNKDEIDFLQNGYFKYLKAVSIAEKIKISEEELKKIINKTFPDLRSGTQMLQEIHIVGNTEQLNKTKTSSHYTDFYSFILNKRNDPMENYFYIIDNFTENPENGFKILGRPFFQYLIEMKPEIIKELGTRILILQKTYNVELDNAPDPLLHLISYISEMKTLIN